jgi:bacteriorhodopsin
MLLSSPSSKIKLEIFLKPFARDTWHLMAVFMLLFIFVMRIIMKREETDGREKYSGAMVLTVSITAQQGTK